MSQFTQEEVVLVVDDSPEALGLINDALEAANINVLLALEGQQALTIAKRMRPDIILLDAVMPRMDGFETCRRLKEDPELAGIPVIFMTGLTETKDIVRGLESGGVDYLTKPIRPDELLARMHVHLTNARITHSAQKALDNSGQYLFSANSTGVINWATPQAFDLISEHAPDNQWKHNELKSELALWLKKTLQAKQRLKFEELEQPLAIEFIEERGTDDYLLKLVNLVEVPDEEILQNHFSLTQREAEVLCWIAQGKTNREIGQILDISPRTVNKHLEQVFDKVGVENRTTAASVAIRLIAEQRTP
ncbi:MAG: response regulator transcription factor [Cellvibrionaceae bacterium]